MISSDLQESLGKSPASPITERLAYVFFLFMLAFSQISIAETQIALGFCVLFFLSYWLQQRPRLASSGVEAAYWMDSRLRWATHGITVTYGVVIMMSLLMLLAIRSSFQSALRAGGLPEFFLEKLWQAGWRIFLAQPWLGWGWRDLVVLYPDFAPPEADLTRHPFYIGHVHNNFLQMAIIGGIAGLTAFVWLWFAIGKKLFWALRQMPDSYLRDAVLGAFCAFIAYLLASFFDWSFGDEEITMALWLIVGLGFAAARMARIEREASTSSIGT